MSNVFTRLPNSVQTLLCSLTVQCNAAAIQATPQQELHGISMSVYHNPTLRVCCTIQPVSKVQTKPATLASLASSTSDAWLGSQQLQQALQKPDTFSSES